MHAGRGKPEEIENVVELGLYSGGGRLARTAELLKKQKTDKKGETMTKTAQVRLPS